MRLFTRTVQLTGTLADGLAISTEIRAFVSAKSGVEIGLWLSQFGAPVGTVVYAAAIDGLAQLHSIDEALVADPAYHALLARGAEYVTTPPVDGLSTPLHGDLGDPPPVGSAALVTTAVVAGGKYAEAMAWGVDMAVHSENVTGYPVGFHMDDFGTFGSVAWVSAAPDLAAIDVAADKLNADSSYLEKLGAVGDLFVPASGHRSMAIRIA